METEPFRLTVEIPIEVPPQYAEIVSRFPKDALIETCIATAQQSVDKMFAMLIAAHTGGVVDDNLEIIPPEMPRTDKEVSVEEELTRMQRWRRVRDPQRSADPDDMVGNVIDFEAHRMGPGKLGPGKGGII
jgi:hypothetical protein